MSVSVQGNRRYKWKIDNCIGYIGDLKSLEDYLDSKVGLFWLIPKFIDSLLRGIGQVCFANNPISGLLILFVLFWAGINIGLATLLSSSTSILTATILKLDPILIRNGLTTFNGVLVGSVTSALSQPILHTDINTKIWLFIFIGSIISVFIGSGIGTITGKLNLPPLTLPFNITTLCIFLTLIIQKPSSIITTTNQNITKTPDIDIENGIDWENVLNGIFLSFGEVYGIDTFVGSIIIFIALFIYSPLLSIMSGIGAIIGTLGSLIILDYNLYETTYLGLWGYNSLLSSGAIIIFYAPNTHSFITAPINVIFTILIQYSLSIIFKNYQLPVLTLPFVLSTFIFLSISTTSNYLYRITKFSFPELQRYNYTQDITIQERSSLIIIKQSELDIEKQEDTGENIQEN